MQALNAHGRPAARLGSKKETTAEREVMAEALFHRLSSEPAGEAAVEGVAAHQGTSTGNGREGISEARSAADEYVTWLRGSTSKPVAPLMRQMTILPESKRPFRQVEGAVSVFALGHG